MKKSTKTSRKFDQSEDRPFKSFFKEGYITAADYICELVFKKRASISKTAVPESFWNSEEYKKQYVGQAIHARRLLKSYPVSVIIKAFENTPYCLSLTNDKMKPLLEKYKKEFDDTEVKITKTEEVIETPRKQIGKGKNRLGDL